MKQLTIFLLILLSFQGFGQAIDLDPDSAVYTSGTAINLDVVYGSGESFPVPVPTNNLIGFWDETYGIESDSTIDLLNSSGVISYTIKITGLDWPIDSVWGIPMKTIATFKLQTANTIDTIFWNYSIYPTHVYQDIDLNHKTFFKKSSHTINSDSTEHLPSRISSIAIYSAALSGSDLTAANIYFNVPSLPISGIKYVKQDRTKDYAKLDSAFLGCSAGDTIFVYSGNYTEATATLDYLRDNRNISYTCIGLGRVNIQPTGTTRIFGSSGVVTSIKNFSNLIFNGKGTTQSVGNNLYAMQNYFRNCVFTGITTYWFAASRLIEKCVNNTSVEYDLIGSNLTESYGAYVTISSGTSPISYCKIKSVTATKQCIYSSASATDINIRYNHFIPLLGNVRIVNVQTPHTFTYKGNYSLATAVTYQYGLRLDWADVSSPSTVKAWIKNNTIIDSSEYASAGTAINVLATGLIDSIFINNNYIYSSSIKARNGIAVLPILASPHIKYVQIQNNSIYQNSYAGIGISFSETVIDTIISNADVKYNYLRGPLYKNYTAAIAASATAHGLLISSGINNKVAYNYVSYFVVGYVMKSKTYPYTGGGLYYNIGYNNFEQFYFRRIRGLNAFNNTFYNEQSFRGSRIGAIDAQDGQMSYDITLKNNIMFYDTTTLTTNMVFAIDSFALNRGINIDTNVISHPNYSARFINNWVDNYSLSTAITNGWSVGNYISNPNFNSSTQFWPKLPSDAIENGANLGATFNQGLDITTSFPSVVLIPSVVLKTQPANWTIGAYP